VRAAFAVLLVLLAAPATSIAQPPFLGPDARVFTLAGGGSAAPRDGLPATRADLGRHGLRGLAALPDGSVALVTRAGLPLLVAPDARIRLLPRPPGAVAELAAAPDGTLLAATSDAILRLPAGAVAWTEALRLPRRVVVQSLDALVDGFVFVDLRGDLRRVDAGGAIADVPAPAGRVAEEVAALPGGGFAYTAVDDYVGEDERIVVVPTSGPARTLATRRRLGSSTDFAALPDGTFVRARESLELLDRAGRMTSRIGWQAPLGYGEGGPAAHVLLAEPTRLALAADGALVVDDIASSAAGPADRWAFLPPGGALVTGELRRRFRTTVVRILAPAGAARPLVAVAPSTFETLKVGRIGYVTTFAGHATAVVRRRGRVVATVEADVFAGVGELVRPGAPPRGDLSVTLRVTAPDGTAADARLGVTTNRRLTVARARRTIRQFTRIFDGELFGGGIRAGRCVRLGERRIACEEVEPGGAPSNCIGVFEARLRPDGARAFVRRMGTRAARLACRALTRRA
jgi:hypothetical protein